MLFNDVVMCRNVGKQSERKYVFMEKTYSFGFFFSISDKILTCFSYCSQSDNQHVIEDCYHLLYHCLRLQLSGGRSSFSVPSKEHNQTNKKLAKNNCLILFASSTGPSITFNALTANSLQPSSRYHFYSLTAFPHYTQKIFISTRTKRGRITR